VAEPTLYLFDGWNLLHASSYEDGRALVDALASFVALRGARGIVVFDGAGDDVVLGPLEVRYAPDADALLERLAAERRSVEQVLLVSSDAAVRGTSGQEVGKRSSSRFLRELARLPEQPGQRHELAERLDAATRARLEQLRRGAQ
jgi:predicted RNA-binding protein with PIN domain